MSWFEWLLGSWPKKDRESDDPSTDSAECGDSSAGDPDAEWEDELQTGADPDSRRIVLDESTDMVIKADVICMNHRVVDYLLERYEDNDSLQRVIDALETSTRGYEEYLGLVRRRNRFTSR